MNTYTFVAGDRHLHISSPSLLDVLSASHPSLFFPELTGTACQIYAAGVAYIPHKRGTARIWLISPDHPAYMPNMVCNCIVSGLKQRELPPNGAILPWETPLTKDFDPFTGPLDKGRAYGLFYGLTTELLRASEQNSAAPSADARSLEPLCTVDVLWCLAHCSHPLTYANKQMCRLADIQRLESPLAERIYARINDLLPLLPQSAADLSATDLTRAQHTAHMTLIYFYRAHQRPSLYRGHSLNIYKRGAL